MEGFHKKSAKGHNQKRRSLKRTISNPDPKNLLKVMLSNTANYSSTATSLEAEEAARRVSKKTKLGKNRRMSLGIYASQPIKNIKSSAKSKIAQVVEEIRHLELENQKLKESIKNAHKLEELLIEAYRENSRLKQEVRSSHTDTIEEAMKHFKDTLTDFITGK